MTLLATADLPGTGGTFRSQGDDVQCEEVPCSAPGGDGKHWWVQVAKQDLSTQQCRQAIARAVAVPVELVACAGNRDRRGRCLQWFSIPQEAVEHPQGLRNAGFQSKVKVRQVIAAVKAIDVVGVERLRWRARIRGIGGNDGYRKATAILDALRRTGLPNYIHPSAFGEDGGLARWGHLLLAGKRLPEAVVRSGTSPGRCLWAAQAEIFNRYVTARLAEGLLGRALPGDRVQTARGEEWLVEDVAHAQKRLDSWESLVLGPLFGEGMKPAAGVAAEREAALLAALALDPRAVARLHGDRRPIRVQPTKTLCDIEGKDLVICCDLPVDAYIGVLMQEVVKETAVAEVSKPRRLTVRKTERPSEDDD